MNLSHTKMEDRDGEQRLKVCEKLIPLYMETYDLPRDGAVLKAFTNTKLHEVMTLEEARERLGDA